ncbi:heterogeneous nuclear ribonucleoprotein A1, A2/B1 homolog [Zingiber officinale]|uniref:RRM domain-containing protein n=1 Tax=Zingiber officinale TaxID=94328 RepID=A0A8J5FA44_ZINOF|nr:heterogeneous nuclear ribonucleoprotein A1, A2/B1 homolog [Zingiber officinale]KAG6482683.1 hypothetical protein ZIOFF_059320 [Zingiber officinale]
MGSRMQEHDGASPAKIFVGGLPKDTSLEAFVKHFEQYGEIVDSVIMKDRHTNKPRGFGFITYKDASIVDKVIEDSHVFNGKMVEIKRTIPKGAAPLKDFKTRKIFVGGIPTTLSEDQFKNYFSEFGRVEEHEIIRDHTTNRSRGFGFIVFENEKDVDDLLAKKGNMIDLAGTKVEIKKAEPKKPGNAPPSFGGESRTRHFGDNAGSFGGSYGGGAGSFGGSYGGSSGGSFGSSYGSGGGSFGSAGGYGPSSYRTPASFGPRPGGYGGFGGAASEYGGSYGGYGGSLGDYRGASSAGYSSRFGSYGGGYGSGYGGSVGGGYGREAGSYGGSSYGGAGGAGAGYGSPGNSYGSGHYGGRTGSGPGIGGAGRYHPYGR